MEPVSIFDRNGAMDGWSSRFVWRCGGFETRLWGRSEICGSVQENSCKDDTQSSEDPRTFHDEPPLGRTSLLGHT